MKRIISFLSYIWYVQVCVILPLWIRMSLNEYGNNNNTTKLNGGTVEKSENGYEDIKGEKGFRLEKCRFDEKYKSHC